MQRPDLRDLIQEGQIQEESGIGWDQVERLIKRAFEDLKSAERNLPFDEPGAMDFIYKAMFHAANANTAPGSVNLKALDLDKGTRRGPLRRKRAKAESYEELVTAIRKF
jgi:hypothetical protein